jgi:ribosomal protein L32
MPATLAPPIACPAWCSLPPGHEDGCDIDGSRFIRHRVVVGAVEIEQPVVVEPDGAVDVEPLVVWVDGHAYGIAKAQRLAMELADALTTAGARYCSRCGTELSTDYTCPYCDARPRWRS